MVIIHASRIRIQGTVPNSGPYVAWRCADRAGPGSQIASEGRRRSIREVGRGGDFLFCPLSVVSCSLSGSSIVTVIPNVRVVEIAGSCRQLRERTQGRNCANEPETETARTNPRRDRQRYRWTEAAPLVITKIARTNPSRTCVWKRNRIRNPRLDTSRTGN
jgi:hypothetical protein